MHRLLVVSRSHVFCESLAVVLPHRLPDCTVEAQAATLGEAMACLAGDPSITLVLIDLYPRDDQKLAQVVRLRQQYPDLPMLVVLQPGVAEITTQLLAAGVVQVLPASTVLSALIDALDGRWPSSDAGDRNLIAG